MIYYPFSRYHDENLVDDFEGEVQERVRHALTADEEKAESDVDGEPTPKRRRQERASDQSSNSSYVPQRRNNLRSSSYKPNAESSLHLRSNLVRREYLDAASPSGATSTSASSSLKFSSDKTSVFEPYRSGIFHCFPCNSVPEITLPHGATNSMKNQFRELVLPQATIRGVLDPRDYEPPLEESVLRQLARQSEAALFREGMKFLTKTFETEGIVEDDHEM